MPNDTEISMPEQKPDEPITMAQLSAHLDERLDAIRRDQPMDAKRLFFDWSFLIPLVALAVAWGTISATVAKSAEEIKILREAREQDRAAALQTAEKMATREDVQRVIDQLNALSVEIRRQR